MELKDKIQMLRERREGVHMAHVYYGDPNEEFSISLIKTLAENGADIIEFGIPFSDPISDGTTFQAACERALNAGITPEKCIRGVERLRGEGLETPIVVTTYFNIPYIMGFEKFLDKIAAAKAQAILIPDLPVEEAKPFMKIIEKRKMHLILQVAPTTSQERCKKILAEASAFIYLIGLEGVTGSRIRGLKATLKLIKTVKEITDKPLLVGFGVSKREHVETMVSGGADGVVVGSAYARIYAENLENPFQKLPKIAKLATEIKTGCMNGYKKGSSENYSSFSSD
ncbi:MAG: tryptophan synthase subunit alpha [Candidatus Bathyarchaeia archaeon]